MGKKSVDAIVLDAGALIAFERGSGRMRALARQALKTKTQFVIPAGALGQAWRDGARQTRLAVLVASAQTDVPALDRAISQAAGTLCGRSKTSDVIDATVVLEARKRKARIITSDVGDLQRLDPRAVVLEI